jgi:transcriptional regulator with XRE-family HTH domain
MSARADRTGRIIEVLRRELAAALAAGVSLRSIERGSGVLRQTLSKFLRGRTLRLDFADKLAGYFGLVLVKRNRRRVQHGKPGTRTKR